MLSKIAKKTLPIVFALDLAAIAKADSYVYPSITKPTSRMK